jgi:hypothetical protein
VYVDDPADPDKRSVYDAQSAVARVYPFDDLADLPATKEYVATLGQHLGVDVPCYRGWWYDDQGAHVVHRPGQGVDADFEGEEYTLQSDEVVALRRPPTRWSTWDVELREIVVGSPLDQPLSHHLLIAHELAHALTPLDFAGHGAEFRHQFISIVEHHLSHMATMLTDEFRNRDLI